MSIQSEITRITNNVQDTIDVIEQTGVSVPDGANSDNLPSLAQALANEKQDKLTGSQGQFVGFTADNVVGALDAPVGLPSGGTSGQMLYQGESGAEWGDKPVMLVQFTLIYGSRKWQADKTYAEIDQAIQDGYAVLPHPSFGGALITTYGGDTQTGIIFYCVDVNNDCAWYFTINSDDTVTAEDVPIITKPTEGGQVLKSVYRGTGISRGEYTTEWALPDSDVVYVTLLSNQADMTPSEIRNEVNDGKTVVAAQSVRGKYIGTIMQYVPKGSCSSTAVFVGLDDELNMWKATISSDKSATMELVDKYLPISGGDITGSLTVAGVLRLLGGDPTIPTQAANKSYVDSKVPKSVTVTLPASGWSSNTQTVTVQGVLADESAQLIQPMPAVASQNAYITAGVICSGQGENQLTFTCSTTPTEDISLYVVITEVSA